MCVCVCVCVCVCAYCVCRYIICCITYVHKCKKSFQGGYRDEYVSAIASRDSHVTH